MASERPPDRLHRVNGFDASVTLIQSMLSVRRGSWVGGAPSHIAAELLGELAARGYYLGVENLAVDPGSESRQ